MNTPLQRRLAALESLAASRRSEDTPEARAVCECLSGMFAAHDADGSIRAAFDAAADAQARAVAVCDLLDRAGCDAERELLNLLALAEGRHGTPINP